MRLLFLAALVLLIGSAPAAARVGIGINYDWYATYRISMRECRPEGEPLTQGKWFLQQYDDARIRATVQEQLAAMRQAGFTTLRTLVFHDHATDPEVDSFVSLDGSITPADRAKLHDFVADVARAGFTTLELVPSFVSQNWLYCNEHVWGDCFDPRTTDENWRFTAVVAQTAIDAAGPMTLRFDIGSELAPDPHMPAATLRKAKTYLQTMARRFQARFGSTWLISAARSDGSTASETAARTELLLDDLAQAGLRPRYLELHTYLPDGNDLKQSLDTLQRIAQRIDAYVILGELRYHSDVQAATIATWLAKHPQSRVVDVMQWPEYDPSHICAIDPSPPYTPGLLGKLLPPRRRSIDR